MNWLELVVTMLAFYGLVKASIDVGRCLARISMAIDELIYQRKQRKKL